MTILLTPTEDDLRARRSDALGEVGLTEEELTERADRSLLTREEARALRRIREIDFLLGND